MDLNKLSESMFHALVQGGIQRIVDAAFSVIQLPILVVDSSYNLLGATSGEGVDDWSFSSILADKKASSNLIWQYQKEKYIESVCKSPRPVYLNWGSLDIPQISGAIRVNGVISGYIGVVCPQENFSEEVIDASVILANALALDLGRYKNTNTQKFPLLEIFTRELLNGKISNAEQLEIWKINFEYIFKHEFLLIAVRSSIHGEETLLQYFSANFTAKHPYVLSTIIDNILYLIVYNFTEELYGQRVRKIIQEVLTSFQAWYSISKSFHNILETPAYRAQLQKTIEIGTLMEPKKNSYDFSDYYIPIVLGSALENLKSLSLVHPIIEKLKSYDKENNTDYLKTLEIYILSFCNNNALAERLHLHRNTVTYRLNKISEITEINFNNESTCTELMLSFLLLKYSKKLASSASIPESLS